MTTPFIGEIQVFGFDFAPAGWAQCNGATLQVRQYPALFSLIGNLYGGDGRVTFQLPNFSGRAACGQGQGVGLTPRTVGEDFGSAQVSLIASEIPVHNHVVNLYRQPNTALQSNTPGNGYGLIPPAHTSPFVQNTSPNTNFAPTTVGIAGGGLPHENRQPLLALNFCIALGGEFPTFD